MDELASMLPASVQLRLLSTCSPTWKLFRACPPVFCGSFTTLSWLINSLAIGDWFNLQSLSPPRRLVAESLLRMKCLKSWLGGRIGELAILIGKRSSGSSSIVGYSSCISQVSTFALSLVSFSKRYISVFCPNIRRLAGSIVGVKWGLGFGTE